jgi:hypothetical protein
MYLVIAIVIVIVIAKHSSGTSYEEATATVPLALLSSTIDH